MIVICKSCKKNMNTKIVEDSFWCGHCENYFCYECCQDIEEIEVIEDGVKIMMPSVHKKAEEVCASLFFEASDESLDNIVKRWSGEKNDPYFIIAKKLLNAQISIQSELEKVEVILKKEKYIKNYLKKIRPCFNKSILQAKKYYGQDSNFAHLLGKIANTYMDIGKYKIAEVYYLKILNIFFKYELYEKYIITLINLSNLYISIFDFSKAENLLVEAKEKFPNREQPAFYANLLNLLGDLYREHNHEIIAYHLANNYYQEAKIALEERYSEEYFFNTFQKKYECHIYGMTLNNIGLINSNLFNGSSEDMFLKALKVYKNIFGKQDMEYGRILNNIATLYNKQDRYREAEYYYEKAKNIYDIIFGKDSNEYVVLVSNLITLYFKLGEYDSARILYNDSKEYFMKLIKYSSSLNIKLLMNISEFEYNLQNYKKARQLYEQTLTRLESNNAFYKKNPDYFIVLNKLANICIEQKDYNFAEIYLNKLEKLSISKESSIYSYYLTNKISLHLSLDRFEKADELFSELNKYFEKNTGEKDLNYAISLENLCMINIKLKNYAKALNYLLDALDIRYHSLIENFNISSDKRIGMYLETFQDKYSILFNLFYNNYDQLQNNYDRIFAFVLRTKSLIRKLMTHREKFIASLNDPEVKAIHNSLRGYKFQISNLFALREMDDLKFRDLQEKIDILEKKLIRKLSNLDRKKQFTPIDPDEIFNTLDDCALVEFVYLRDINIENMCYQPHDSYIIFIKIYGTQTMVVDIGPALEINTLITQYKLEISQNVSRKFGYSKNISKNNKSLDVLRKLYNKIFLPIKNKIGNIRKLIVAVDGSIGLIPLGVLIQENNRLVLEDYEISYLDSGEDILNFKEESIAGNIPVVISNPNFDFMYTDSDNLKFKKLDHSEFEGKEISELINCKLIEENQVLDPYIKKIERPVLFHIATHTYFKENENITENLFLSHFHDKSYFKEKKYYETLISSGFVLAGINKFMQNQNFSEVFEDGFLTALDILSMDFYGTELAVLSACESGWGKIRMGEGVYGLRHAFIIQGVKTIIMSLWPVPDKQTKELMILFYKNLIQRKSKSQALLEAQRTLVNSLREKHLDLAILCGGFICFGAPGKMHSKNEKKFLKEKSCIC